MNEKKIIDDLYCSLNNRNSSSTSINFVFKSLRSHKTCRNSSSENRGCLASNVVKSLIGF